MTACQTCGSSFDYDGRGRPRKHCLTCKPRQSTGLPAAIFRLPEEQLEALRRIAVESQRNISDVIRDALAAQHPELAALRKREGLSR